MLDFTGLQSGLPSDKRVSRGTGCSSAAIRAMFAEGFAQAAMVCVVENLFEDGEWAILEWRDPLGLRGCGFFRVREGRIAFPRGYWDKLSFLKLHGLPPPRGAGVG